MKRLFLLFFLISISVGASWFSWFYLTSPLNPDDQTYHQVVIQPNSSVQQIAQTLTKHQLIRSPLAFRLLVRYLHLDRQLQAGLFRLSPSQTPTEIAQALTKGQLDVWVTIPEGYRNEEIANLFHQKFNLSYSQFMLLAKGKSGKLFPDTYLIPRQITPQQVIHLLLNNYHKKLAPYQTQIQHSSLTETQILTLASIIERETLTNAEKPIVAGILLKRLQHNWPLQVDATIQYILGKPGNWWPVITLADRRLQSPYNTYLNTGLPPAPIANPGIASIKAVLFPTKTDYWFYLHDQSGHIHYAKTNAEHQQNIKQYIR